MSSTADILSLQLASCPVRNRAVTETPLPDGGVRLSVPLAVPPWLVRLRWLLPLSDARRIDLDELGAALWAQCDGTHPVEALIDQQAARWQLSFFEARAMVLFWLQRLMRAGMLGLAVDS
jgi:hypothetical protein